MDTADKTISTFKNKVSFWLTFLIPLLLMCFSVPLLGDSLDSIKSALIVLGTGIVAIFFLVEKINTKDFNVRISVGGVVSFIFCLVILLASAGSSTPTLSFLGNGVEEPSGLTTISAVLFSFLFVKYQKNNLVKFSSLFLIFYIFSTLFSVAFFIFPTLVGSLGKFNLFGNLNSFAIVSGITLPLAILFFQENKNIKTVSIISIFLSFAVLLFVNSKFSFILASILLAFVFFKNIVLNKDQRFPALTFIVLTLIIFFIFGRPIIGDFFPNIINLKISEVSPNFDASYAVLKEQLKEDLFLGSGPSRFLDSWMRFQPESVVQSPFWNNKFYSGQNNLFYFGVTSGVIGLFCIFLMILYAFALFIKKISKSNELDKNIEQLFLLSAIFILLFFNLNIGLLLFSFMGLLLVLINDSPFFVFSSNSVFKRRFSVFVISLGLFLGVTLFILGFLKFSGLFLTEKSQQKIFNIKDLNSAQTIVEKAIEIFPNYIALENSFFLKRQIVFDKINDTNSELQPLITNSISSATKLINYNPNSYFSWVDVGSYFSDLARFGVENAHDEALSAFNQAQMLSPKNPTPELMLGRLSLIVGDIENARKHLNNSINMKSNYSDPYIYLGILEEKNGNYSIAESNYQKAVNLNLSERGFVNLGNFYLRSGDLDNAKESFIRAVALSSNINQNYLTLAMIYSSLGENNNAVDLLSAMIRKYPEDKVLKDTLQKINIGDSFDEFLLGKEIIIP